MAAKAHAIRNYSFAGFPERPRRQVWLQDDEEVVLPRGRNSQISGVLVLSALLASALVGGATYAIYRSAPPELSETATLPLATNWQIDPTFGHASFVKAMQGPALAAVAPQLTPAPTDESPVAALAPRRGFAQREVVIDDSSPGLQEALPQPSENRQPQPALTQPMLPPDPIVPEKAPALPDIPYPSPTMTPPEMTEPHDDGLGSPKLDLDSPY